MAAKKANKPNRARTAAGLRNWRQRLRTARRIHFRRWTKYWRRAAFTA